MGQEETIGSVQMQDLLKAGGVEASLNRLYATLDQLITSEAAKKDVNPNELVRIVHDGKVTWVTAQQAELYLKSDSSDEENRKLRANVERALKGESRIIHQELRVLLALAQGMFRKQSDEGLLAKEETERIGPSLQRRDYEIKDTFEQLSDVEQRITAARERQPLIADYEQRMGKLLNLQQAGQMDEARKIAAELAADKKKYILLSRALEPDVNTSYYYRLGAQKIKKKILNVHQTFCHKQEGAVDVHINELRSHLHTVQQQMSEAESVAGLDPTQAEIAEKTKTEMEKTTQEIEEASNELQAIRSETKVLQKQEKETQQVIEHVATNVLQNKELAVDVQSQVKNLAARKKIQPRKAPPAQETSSKIRMATADRRK